MKETFVEKSFSKKTVAVLGQANEIIEELQEQGFDLTVRQLYYQFVQRGLIPNTQSEYRKLKDAINNGRLAGLVDWEAIVDRTRTSRGIGHWHNPQDIISSAASSYAKDTRRTQKHYVEVWVEKDALIGIVGKIADDLDIKYFSCRGFTSQTSMYDAGHRFMNQEVGGKGTILLYLGDHDPSGLDMVRDIQERLTMFGSEVFVKQIALTMDQIEEFSPPPNPAKVTDSRYEAYQELYGDDSWELDALDPRRIETIIRDGVESFTDEPARKEIISEQEQERTQLNEIANLYDDIVAEFLGYEE